MELKQRCREIANVLEAARISHRDGRGRRNDINFRIYHTQRKISKEGSENEERKDACGIAAVRKILLGKEKEEG
ncbi:hypothetical protein ACH3XW_26645 [Acanthocheilonema viteae]